MNNRRERWLTVAFNRFWKFRRIALNRSECFNWPCGRAPVRKIIRRMMESTQRNRKEIRMTFAFQGDCIPIHDTQFSFIVICSQMFYIMRVFLLPLFHHSSKSAKADDQLIWATSRLVTFSSFLWAFALECNGIRIATNLRDNVYSALICGAHVDCSLEFAFAGRKAFI